MPDFRAPILAVRISVSVLLACAFLVGNCPRVGAQTKASPAVAPPSAAQAADAKPDSALLVVAGDVPTPLSLSLADLGALPRTTLTVMNEHEKKQETYQGVSLAEILKRAGVPQGEQLRGAAFSTYVRADAADGYSMIFSLGELDSSIEDLNVIVADTLDGHAIPDKLGPLRLVVPNDKRPARWVRMLRSITVVKVPR